jgi:hypothetical protein
MESKNFTRAALLMLAVVVLSAFTWEAFLRTKGYTVAYDDGAALWSNKRDMAYGDVDKSTVFIGSSRIKFDLDLETWKKLTGDEPVQLAIQGNSPRRVLENLAKDEKFKGRLIVDVTEPLFFRQQGNTESEQFMSFYKNNHTPSQKAGFVLNHGLESNLVFLDKDNFSLNAMIDKLQIPSRPKVFVFPLFPTEFDRCDYERQSKMTDRFVADTNQQNQVKGVWNYLRSYSKGGPPTGDTLMQMLNDVKKNVDLIRGRGGVVLFVRTPSSNPMLMGENMGFPRDKYWEKLLQVTNSPGIHFMDYPSIANFKCPELSHLSPADAKIFTKELVGILRNTHHWKFPVNDQLAKNP